MPSQEERTQLLPRAAASARDASRNIWEDFQEFINQGKVLDLAVAVILGAAFTSIVSSLVEDVLAPVLGLLISSHPLEEAFWVIRRAKEDSDGCLKHPDWCANPKTIDQAKEVSTVTLNYGRFISSVLGFLLVAATLFLVIQAYTSVLHKRSKFLRWTRKCPFCLTEIYETATKCKACCSSVRPLHRGVEVTAAETQGPPPQDVSS
ncbi:hypothetical protein HKX48_005790 [Thoreauomyces humboldtii]|nr:hypothetical protein HKX48_005790 [Thoreauomyces humboldtii]